MLSHAQQRLPWQRQRSAGLLQQQHRRHLPFGHVAPSPLDRARSWALRTAAATGDHLQRRPMTVDLSGKWVKVSDPTAAGARVGGLPTQVCAAIVCAYAAHPHDTICTA